MSSSVLIVTQQAESALAPLMQALRADDLSPRTATTAEAALQLARQDPPIAVILDKIIQNESDLRLCHWLRTDPATVAVKLLVTAQDSQQRQAALTAGVDEFLCAPLDWVEVRTRLRSLNAGSARMPTLDDFVNFTPDMILGSNPVDVLGNADMLSHDLKSPLSIIISSLELLDEYHQDNADGALSAEDNAWAMRLGENAILAARRAIFLIDDMIDLAKLEVDAYPLVPEPFDLAALIDEQLAESAAALERKGITVTLTPPTAVGDALGDRALVKRVINALLDNTIKFTQSGDEASIALTSHPSHILLALTDSGRSILPQYQDSIFERAVQWEARQQGGRTSVGMGLQFARTALRRMNGDLTAASAPNGTTTFTLRLPTAS